MSYNVEPITTTTGTEPGPLITQPVVSSSDPNSLTSTVDPGASTIAPANTDPQIVNLQPEYIGVIRRIRLARKAGALVKRHNAQIAQGLNPIDGEIDPDTGEKINPIDKKGFDARDGQIYLPMAPVSYKRLVKKRARLQIKNHNSQVVDFYGKLSDGALSSQAANTKATELHANHAKMHDTEQAQRALSNSYKISGRVQRREAIKRSAQKRNTRNGSFIVRSTDGLEYRAITNDIASPETVLDYEQEKLIFNNLRNSRVASEIIRDMRSRLKAFDTRVGIDVEKEKEKLFKKFTMGKFYNPYGGDELHMRDPLIAHVISRLVKLSDQAFENAMPVMPQPRRQQLKEPGPFELHGSYVPFSYTVNTATEQAYRDAKTPRQTPVTSHTPTNPNTAQPMTPDEIRAAELQRIHDMLNPPTP